VVMEGMVFTNVPNTSPSQFRCFDEATGQVMYTANGSISNGIHLPGSTYQQGGRAGPGEVDVILPSSYGSYQYPYLYGVSGSTWNYYDVLTGDIKYQFANATGARLIDGTMLAFGVGTITGQTGRYVFRWNLTSVVNNNWPTGIQWKVKQPLTSWGANPSLFAVSSDVSVVVIGTKNQYWGFSADTGAQLWNITLPYPISSNEEIPLAIVDDFFVFDATAATFHCYSMKTGAELWETPSFADSPWATTYTVYFAQTNDLNNVYMAFPDGAMRAYSLTDGHLIWTSKPFASTEYANNAVPYCYAGVVMIDDKLYGYAGYSTTYQINPIPRFNMLVCINATNGDTVFALNGGIDTSAAANGYVLGPSINDGNIYCIGKGPTETTVMASPKVFAQGSSVLIEGSVMDTSPATQEYASQARFPKGIPAVADEDMSEWMDYLYMQNATMLNNPPASKGVSVWLTAVGSNGDAIDIGTVTSDSDGLYKKTWTPPSEGEYKVYATFDGSESYYGSYGVTALSVTKAPEATNGGGIAVEPADYSMLLYGILVAVVIAIIIGLIAIALVLRKR
jgi:hypothetical protein